MGKKKVNIKKKIGGYQSTKTTGKICLRYFKDDIKHSFETDNFIRTMNCNVSGLWGLEYFPYCILPCVELNHRPKKQ